MRTESCTTTCADSTVLDTYETNGSDGDGIKDKNGAQAHTVAHKKCGNEEDTTKFPAGLFGGNRVAKGFAFAGMGQALVLSSVVYMSNSLLFLASEAAGCVNDNGRLIRGCENTIYGFKPTTLLSNIYVIQGLLNAFCMPIIGAVIDCTSLRRGVGRTAAILIWVFQLAQIGTVSSTWFIMSLLQAVIGFLFELNYISAIPYVIQLSSEMTSEALSFVNRNAFICYFAVGFTYTVAIALISSAVGLNQVQTAHFSQSVYVVAAGPLLYMAWIKLLPAVPARRQLAEGKKLWMEGFRQNWRTCIRMQKDFKQGLRWFLISTAFSEGGITSMPPIAITFMTEGLRYEPNKVALSFAVAIVAAIPGCMVAHKVARWMNPKFALQTSLVAAMSVAAGGSWVLREEWPNMGFAFCSMWGVVIGWYFTSQRLFFSLATPQGQEAELSGFFVYCQLIISWLPPLTFSVIVSKGVELRYGMISLCAYQFLGLLNLMMAGPWDNILREAKNGSMNPVEVEGSAGSSEKTSENDVKESIVEV